MYMYHSVSLKQTINSQKKIKIKKQTNKQTFNSAKDSHKKIFSKRKFKKKPGRVS